MIWPFRKKPQRPRSRGSFMHESGVLECKCGERIPVEVAIVLKSVPTNRFRGMRPARVLVTNIPCPGCEKSYSFTVEPGQ